MKPHWLITGATGLLASYLIEACRAHGRVTTTARSGGDRKCDLSARGAAGALIAEVAPDIVVHAAGLTDVEECERVPEQAFATNRDTCASLAAALPAGATLVVISTDQVYPDTPGLHREDETGPVNVYGRSKYAGERAALVHAGALVLRTNFFGASHRKGRRSLSDFVIDSLSQQKNITLFEDVFFSPLHMKTLAALLVESLERGLTGVFNAGCRAGASKAAFGLAVARHKHLQTETAALGSSSILPGRAPRPHDLRLDLTKIETALGRPMPTLDEEIAKL